MRLKPRVMEVLVYLIEHPGEVMFREAILEQVWGDTFVGDEVLTVAIRDLRKALGDDPREPRFIQTFPGKGYRLIAPVSSVGSDDTKRAHSIRWTTTLSVAAAVIALLATAWRVGFLPRVTEEPSDRAVPRLAHPVQLTSAEGVEGFPAWSPDGRLLAYATQSDALLVADTDVWVLPIAGGEPLNRTADYVGINNFPSWLPDGSGVAFRSDRDGPGIYTMPSLTGPAHKLIEVGDVFARTSRSSRSRVDRRDG